MASPHGAFVWYELIAADIAAAANFYKAAFGWETRNAGVAGIDYRIFQLDGKDVAGLMSQPEPMRAAGAPPAWFGYVAVRSVDTAAKKIAAKGGKIYREPTDIPDIGRFAMVCDPQGALLYLFKPKTSSEHRGEHPAPDAPGHVGWHELMAGDLDTAFPFYADLFGWKKADAIDMGAMGTYQLFANGKQTLGGMMTKPATVPRPYWGYYFNVSGIDSAARRVAAAGGHVINGPMEVPGGMWILHGIDPQGAFFALVGPKG